MFEKALILGMYAVSPLHPGSGSEISVIDLPVQREKHTGFPVVWGQSLKGALRHAYEKRDKEKATVIFGPETDRASEHAGAISVGDAKVLLFPVRSAKGVFAYVTSPLVLRRFLEDLSLAGLQPGNIPIPEETTVHSGSAVIISKNGEHHIVLEDLRLKARTADLSGIAEEIAKVAPISKEGLLKRLVIVPDDVFSAFVRVGTEIVARVRINPDTGTVQEGALWYEEFIPRDTVMYAVIAVSKPRKEHAELKDAESVASELKEFIKDASYLQIGGDETVGKGFVKLSLV